VSKSNRSKPTKDKEPREREEYERVGMVDSLQCSRVEPTEYVAPDPGGKMAALFVVGLMRISSSAKAVATALIWHANSKNGRCDPGIGRLGHETNLCRTAVIKALKQLRREGILVRTRRKNASNAYQLNWRGLINAFVHFETAIVTGWCTKAHQGSALTDTPLVHERAPKPIKRTHEGNPCPERVSSDEATSVENQRGKEEGKQGELVGKPSPTLDLTAGLYAEAKAEVLSKLTEFEKDWLSSEGLGAAIAAEVEEPGSGRAIAASLAHLSWMQSRKDKREAS
jgi:hypothetical protein